MAELYCTARTYFDSGCSEFSNYPVRRKLLDIGYATWHGHDIMEDIRFIHDNYPHVSKYNIHFAIHDMLAELNNCSPAQYYMTRNKNSLENDVKTLIKDLMKVYRLPADKSRKPYLADKDSIIDFYELRLMNGWKEALEEDRQPNKMFSDGNWIMFPGDGEIIRNFNLSTIDQDKGYLSYVYPEPWYGLPTSAKIIVLGNEARYDNLLCQIMNLRLTKRPAMAEEVQLMADDWLMLERGSFHDYDYNIISSDILRPHDLYNSPTYRFWAQKIMDFSDYAFLPRTRVFNNIAVINANPYTAHNVGPLEPGLLPSHYFLRLMVRYIVSNNPDVLFILPTERLRPIWQEILADVFDKIVAQDRIITTGRNKTISLISDLNKDKLARIEKALAK